jgi:hypothetical protein
MLLSSPDAYVYIPALIVTPEGVSVKENSGLSVCAGQGFAFALPKYLAEPSVQRPETERTKNFQEQA